MAHISLIGKWRLLSFEQKLSIVGAPILLLVLGGIAVPAINSAMTKAAPDLRVERLLVRDGRTGDYTIRGVRKPPGRPGIHVTLVNRGTGVSIVTQAQLRVVGYWSMPACISAGFIEPSQRYGVVLPPHPALGTLVTKAVSQEVRDNDSDRFAFQFRATDVRVAKLNEGAEISTY